MERDREVVRRRKDGSIPKLVEGIDTSAIQPPPPIDPNAPGGRIFEMRRMARVSRATLEAVAGLTFGHLGRLEYGRKQLVNVYTIYRILAALRRFGIVSHVDWVALGIGERPTYSEPFYQRYPAERPGAAEAGDDPKARAKFEEKLLVDAKKRRH